MDHATLPAMLDLMVRWLAKPPEPERCSHCRHTTGDVVSLTRWPVQTNCPHCGADLCPF
jgi:hypothetical protein